MVILHNGIRVASHGPDAYCGGFSSILIFNRGVHEPLEEYVFQEVLKVMPDIPTMLELGAYWAHYSMWMKKRYPCAMVHMVEPNSENLQVGMKNFSLNGLTGEFLQAFVGVGHFVVDDYLQEKGISKLNILHSDIQGFEVEMLQGSIRSLQDHLIDYIFISTHSQELHGQVIDHLTKYGYRVEVSSDFDFETTSYDGFIFASSPLKDALFKTFNPLGRIAISQATPNDLLASLVQIANWRAEPTKVENFEN